MRVLIADTLDATCVEQLQNAGLDVVYDPELEGERLREAVGRTDCRVLVVRSTKVTAEVIGAGDALGVIVRAGAGVNTIDLEAASARSVLVSNCPGRNAVAVAELTLGLILALDRRIVENTIDLKEGRWNKRLYAKAAGLKDRTLGILGVGQIGEAVARRAQAFEMAVIGWSRSMTPARAKALGIECADSPADVARRCDVLSIHLAAAAETRGLVNAELLSLLRPGSFVVNTSRADVVDHPALLAAMRARHLRVALDVFPDEPAEAEGAISDSPVLRDGILYGTHHIGASTAQAQRAIAEETVAIVLAYARTGAVRNCVNIERSDARHVLVVRHLNRPGVLAHTLHVISHAGINVAEMENIICRGGASACAQIKLDGPLDDDALRAIQGGNEHILAVSLGGAD